MKKYHLIILGAGSGGLVCAAGAAQMGARVALIEKHKMGGDCLNTGCVPSKAVIRSAKLAYDAYRSAEFGLEISLSDIHLKTVMDSMRRAQAKIAPHDSVERFTGLGADVYLGDFNFISPHVISNGQETLSGKRIVIATGSSPAVPEIPGLEEVQFLTSENVWDLEELPARLAILGGGPIGSELAQTFSRLGSKVTLIQRGERLLPREDEEISSFLKGTFEWEGIQVRLAQNTQQIRKLSQGFELILNHPQQGESAIPFDQLLIATGRKPNVGGLRLEQAGVQFDKKGIKVDPYLRTSAKHIYSCGDVSGPYLFTHTADHQARTVLRNALFPGKSKINYQIIPWSTFTDPEIARVGLNEIEAKKKKIAYQVYQYSLSNLDRAVCDREENGFIKVLTPPKSDKILGVTLVSPHGGDLLGEISLAMQQGLGLKTLSNLIHVYPTLSEIYKRVAGTFQSSRLTPRTKKWMRRYFRWRLG